METTRPRLGFEVREALSGGFLFLLGGSLSNLAAVITSFPALSCGACRGRSCRLLTLLSVMVCRRSQSWISRRVLSTRAPCFFFKEMVLAGLFTEATVPPNGYQSRLAFPFSAPFCSSPLRCHWFLNWNRQRRGTAPVASATASKHETIKDLIALLIGIPMILKVAYALIIRIAGNCCFDFVLIQVSSRGRAGACGNGSWFRVKDRVVGIKYIGIHKSHFCGSKAGGSALRKSGTKVLTKRGERLTGISLCDTKWNGL